ncbi:MAG: HD-GYP domain-containing protein [Anaerolineae bacterium]|nr:HD-GYP domain-containing protein [Anaerolineae bacterium]
MITTQPKASLILDHASLGWLVALGIYDINTWKHSRRVAELAQLLAKLRGVEDERSEHIWYGALMHDIGKIYIPQKILQKPDTLSNEEWKLMRRHPTFAYNLLTTNKSIAVIKNVAYCHHERWDGTGYPRGLGGDDIPLSARIFAIVDVWDALRSDRPYRKAWPLEKVRSYIANQAGKHFDPLIADTFLHMDLSGVSA